MSFGGMHVYAINPARDFGPRLFTGIAGFRNNALTDGARVWWVPVTARLLGGLIGATVYDFGIRRFLRALAACIRAVETRRRQPPCIRYHRYLAALEVDWRASAHYRSQQRLPHHAVQSSFRQLG